MSGESHEFQAEVKKLLDLMIHSLYTNKDVFLRELVSNASDALDRLRFAGLTDATLLPSEPLSIGLVADPEARTLTIEDNGIGMSHDEMVENLGTIARSGTLEFLRTMDKESEGAPDLMFGCEPGPWQTFGWHSGETLRGRLGQLAGPPSPHRSCTTFASSWSATK